MDCQNSQSPMLNQSSLNKGSLPDPINLAACATKQVSAPSQRRNKSNLSNLDENSPMMKKRERKSTRKADENSSQGQMSARVCSNSSPLKLAGTANSENSSNCSSSEMYQKREKQLFGDSTLANTNITRH